VFAIIASSDHSDTCSVAPAVSFRWHLFGTLDWNLRRAALHLVFSPRINLPAHQRLPAPGQRVRGFDARRSFRNRMTTLIWIKVWRERSESDH
jgi:hypothetical protein